MRCPRCHADNPDTVNYCTHCGNPITQQYQAAPPEKKERNWGIWVTIAAGCAFLFLVITTVGIPLLSGPAYDCSVKDGYITVVNVPDADAYLQLQDINDTVIKTVYIKAGAQKSIDDICNGRYYLSYEIGTQWDSSNKQFVVVQESGRFLDPLDFKGDNYYEVSLVPGSGDARTTSVRNTSAL